MIFNNKAYKLNSSHLQITKNKLNLIMQKTIQVTIISKQIYL